MLALSCFRNAFSPVAYLAIAGCALCFCPSLSAEEPTIPPTAPTAEKVAPEQSLPPSQSQLSAAPTTASDPYFDRLFRLCCSGKKVNSDDRHAACQLLSSACRHEGERWRIVLDELRNDNGRNQHCLEVLGKIAAVDARARDILAMPPEKRALVAWMPDIALDDSVVPELLEWAGKAEGHFVDHYIIALAKARDPRAREFLTHVLLDDEGKNQHPSNRFHAAVGLANFGDARAMGWLIEHCDAKSASVFNAWPTQVGGSGLDASCVRALQFATGQFGLSTKAEFRDWWSKNRDHFKTVKPDMIIDLIQGGL